MKVFTILILASFLCTNARAQNKTIVWTEKEKEFLLLALDTTRAGLLKEVQGLNQTKLHFKPDSSQWSVAEILEHLGVWEELLFWDLFSNQNTPEQPELVSIVKKNDSIMLAYGTDPAKGQSPIVALPLGRFKTKEELVKYFTFFRDEVIKLVRTTTADFRLHFIYRPKDWGVWSVRDLYQYTVIFITHTTRHANQIRRVKAHANYPK